MSLGDISGHLIAGTLQVRVFADGEAGKT